MGVGLTAYMGNLASQRKSPGFRKQLIVHWSTYAVSKMKGIEVRTTVPSHFWELLH